MPFLNLPCGLTGKAPNSNREVRVRFPSLQPWRIFQKGIYYHGIPIGSPLLSPDGILYDTGVPAGYTFYTSSANKAPRICCEWTTCTKEPRPLDVLACIYVSLGT